MAITIANTNAFSLDQAVMAEALAGSAPADSKPHPFWDELPDELRANAEDLLQRALNYEDLLRLLNSEPQPQLPNPARIWSGIVCREFLRRNPQFAA